MKSIKSKKFLAEQPEAQKSWQPNPRGFPAVSLYLWLEINEFRGKNKSSTVQDAGKAVRQNFCVAPGNKLSEVT